MVNFRKFVTSSGLKVFGGRDSANNDKLVLGAKSTDVLLHRDLTKSPKAIWENLEPRDFPLNPC